MRIPIWVTDPTGNNNPYLEILSSNFLLGGTDPSGNSLVDYAIGSNWDNLVNVATGRNVPVLGLAFGVGVWIALVYAVNNSHVVTGTTFYKSTDKGKTWTSVYTATASAVPSGANDSPDQIVFANSKFLAINTSGQNPGFRGVGGTIWTSTDGTNWTSSASPSSDPLQVSSLSVANGKFFIGVLGNSATAYYFSSTDASSWTQSGTAFNNLQPQSGAATGIVGITPGNVAYSASQQVYAASAQYDTNNYIWLTVCKSADGLTWGNGNQFGDFTANDPNNAAGGGPFTQYFPNFTNYNCVFGNGTFAVPAVVQTASLHASDPSGANTYSRSFSRNDIGVLLSSDGASWTFQKIVAGPVTTVPSGTYMVGPLMVTANGYTQMTDQSNHLVAWDPTAGQFLFIANTIFNYAVSNFTQHPFSPPTFSFTGDLAQIYFTSSTGVAWSQSAQFSAIVGDLNTVPTPHISCIGAGLIPAL